MALTQIPIELSSTPGIVDNSNATAITIDSSENVLISGTTSSIDAGSISLEAQGRIRAGRSGGTVLQLNRTSSDGDIAIFYKDGSVVGSIGTTSAGNFAFFTPSEGGIETAAVGILPMNDGVRSDNETDLGFSSARFKDLYLSGGVYLGGTGSANKLDDYEEGTWTPVIKSVGSGGMNATFTVVEAFYTKVGRMVHLTTFIQSINLATITGGTYIVLDGLPFSASGYGDFTIAYKSGAAGTAGNIIGGYVQAGADYAYFMRSSGSEAQQTQTDLQMSKAMINVTYPAS